MPVVVTAADRASFTRCRRQWDFGAGMRQDLESENRPAVPDLDRAVRDALAVYYFPGMWDWDRGVRLPLVGQELDRALTRQRQRQQAEDTTTWQQARNDGNALLARYLDWAPNADRFAPVLVETDFEVNVLDPQRPDTALTIGNSEPIRYAGRIDLMAVDQHDAYWIVRHRVVGADWPPTEQADWPPTEQLVADEETLTACWAWEQFYLGMAITGTVYNELRLPATKAEAKAETTQRQLRKPRWWRGRPPRVRQHEPSGGGRSIPQHRRMYAQASEPSRITPIEQRTENGFRRTWLRRTPAEVAAAGRRLGQDVAEMIRDNLDVYPEPSDQNCPPCPFLDPCQAMQAGRDPGPVIRVGYRQRPPPRTEEGRLGGRAWGLGRGAAPPRFQPRRNG